MGSYRSHDGVKSRVGEGGTVPRKDTQAVILANVTVAPPCPSGELIYPSVCAEFIGSSAWLRRNQTDVLFQNLVS